MTLQNRVDPFGRLVANSARGTLMGNRGCLHDNNHQIAPRPNWTTRAWISCQLEFGGRRRILMTPGRYTELFFLDEPTALAAGHRPCGECRRAAYRQFKEAFLSANGPQLHGGRDAAAIDRLIATDRAAAQRGEYRATHPAALPDGTMVLQSGAPWLKLGRALFEWSFEGYRQTIEVPSAALEVLTPLSLVRTLAIGYRCDAHSTATPPPIG